MEYLILVSAMVLMPCAAAIFIIVLLRSQVGSMRSRVSQSVTSLLSSNCQSINTHQCPKDNAPIRLVDACFSPEPERPYVSYPWGGAEEEIVNRLCNAVSATTREPIGRDRWDMQAGDSIERFAQKIAAARRIIAVISADYLQSEFCMLELFLAYQCCNYSRSDFQEKVIALVLDDAEPLLGNRGSVIELSTTWRRRVAVLKSEVSDKCTDTWRLFHQLDEMCDRMPDMLAALNDIIMPRGYERILAGDFREVMARLSPSRTGE